jgi:putative tricarboxylic transport membrane protein
MTGPATDLPGEARGIPRRTVELGVAALLLVLGVVMIVTNARVGAGWAEDGPQSGYFPLRMGVLLCLCSVGISVQALRMPKEETFVTWERFRPVLQVLGPMLAYVALIQFAGMYVASALFVAGFMKVIGKYSWWKSLLTGVVSSALLFWVFEIKFSVPMPKGPLESHFGF